ncbi:hypothetical protein F4808DRAFT_469178 [Astrocystis sublimbata]|nr:hypothetical protein F4808DRAFT_469178 [Astrocystis sublimbata]
MEPLHLVFAALSIILFLIYRLSGTGRRKLSHARAPAKPTELRKSPRDNSKIRERINAYKQVYYKVQNIEDFPDILPEARNLLLSLLQDGLHLARYKARARSILDIKEYNPAALDRFLEADRQDVSDEFEAYVQRRAAGQGPEMFRSREAATEWLKQNAPLNFIDGAWLAHINKITTPFHLRDVTKNAWQTFSEELGDGDLEKNHVLLYRDLLRGLGVNLPDGDDLDFIHPRHSLDNEQVWRSAVGQLLVSLFPNDFLPEVLGMNLHYESLGMTVLRANKELPEHGISPYYFALHISIDNADSGHSAMAQATITQFMETVTQSAGPLAAQRTWQRIQAGYALSQSLDDTETVQDYEDQIIDMLHKKASLASKIHCTSRARIGKHSLSEWFSSSSSPAKSADLSDAEWREDFLHALADSKPWVYRGDSAKSLLMRELAWKGRMFGAFTHCEVELMRTWIDTLPAHPQSGEKQQQQQTCYWDLVGEPGSFEKTFDPPRRDAAVAHPVFPSQAPWRASESAHLVRRAPMHLATATEPNMKALLTLWFTHPCLLENIVSSTYRTVTPLASHVLLVLRAEMGYLPENTGIAGMDEHARTRRYSPDIVALGLEMMQRQKLPEPACLGDVLGGEDDEVSKFAHALLGWAMRPLRNEAFLLGLAYAFLDLEVWVADSEVLLSKKARAALKKIVARKEEALGACWEELRADEARAKEFVGGYEFGRNGVESLLVC